MQTNIKNPNSKTNWAIGDYVYYINPFNPDIELCTDMITDAYPDAAITPYVRITSGKTLPMTYLFENIETANIEIKRHIKTTAHNIANNIETVSDLILFATKHNVMESGNTLKDQPYRLAYLLKANELLGTNFDTYVDTFE